MTSVRLKGGGVKGECSLGLSWVMALFLSMEIRVFGRDLNVDNTFHTWDGKRPQSYLLNSWDCSDYRLREKPNLHQGLSPPHSPLLTAEALLL